MPPRRDKPAAAPASKEDKPYKRPRKPRVKSTGDHPTKPTPEVNQVGRPPIYDQPYHDDHAKRLALLGRTNSEMAQFFGISTQTMDLWISKYPSFVGAIKWAREEADHRVAMSLFDRAVGQATAKGFRQQVTKDGDVVTLEFEERHAPDTRAAEFWLMNRRPNEWKPRSPERDGKPQDPTAPTVRIEGGLPDE
jgi:hypothetical protein